MGSAASSFIEGLPMAEMGFKYEADLARAHDSYVFGEEDPVGLGDVLGNPEKEEYVAPTTNTPSTSTGDNVGDLFGGGAAKAAEAQRKALEEQTAKAEQRAKEAALQTVQAQATALARDAAIQEVKEKQMQNIDKAPEVNLAGATETIRKKRQKFQVYQPGMDRGSTSQLQI